MTGCGTNNNESSVTTAVWACGMYEEEDGVFGNREELLPSPELQLVTRA